MKMKRLTTLLAVMLMAATGLTAQNVAPRGLFKLQRLGYENGRPDHVPETVQYKLSTDNVPMTLMVHKNTPQDYVYSMRMDEPHPYSCTGDVPVGENGRGTRIYDAYDDRFTLKWYNNLRPNEGAVFPMNEFITEYYDRKNMEPQMVRSIEMLQMKHKKATHRFAGSWRMVGNYGLVDGERILKAPTTHLFKVYGEIYEVDEKTKKEMDELEDVGVLYDCKEVEVETENGSEKVLFYEYIEDTSFMKTRKPEGKWSVIRQDID